MMHARHIFLLVILTAFTLASPVPTSPIPTQSQATPEPARHLEPAWAPEPSARGTFGILTTCLITLALCVWSIIHRDVFVGQTFSQVLWSKICWMMAAILTPETMALHAYHEWKTVKALHGEIREALGVEPSTREDDFGMEGAFFLYMGGYSGKLELTDPEPRSLRHTMLKPLIEQRVVSGGDLRRKDVIDKGKADALAKLLVCFQASWTVVQCIARKGSGLPITLLELHVAVQVVFLVFMYGFWWYKPKEVNEPIMLFDTMSGITLEHSMTSKDPTTATDGTTALTSENLFIAWESFGLQTILSSQIHGAQTHYFPYMLAIMFYSGLHATAWNSHFSTPIEQWLWRGSCILVSVTGGIIRFTKRVKLIQYFVIFSHLVGVSFLLVESFISLRSPPVGTYKTVNWTNYLPHI